MSMAELRDLGTARDFVTQGLWLQRLCAPTPETTPAALAWALEAVADGEGLPPLGFLADLGQGLLGAQAGAAVRPAQAVPGFPSALARAYEDYVLGKLAGDYTLERAGDALRRYRGRDQARGLAYIVQQFRRRTDFDVVALSPAVVKALLRESPARVLRDGWDSLLRDGPLPELIAGYESLVQAVRRCAEVLGPEDLFELEHGTALAEFGQRVALRQVLQAADVLTRGLPPHRPRAAAGRRETPTRVLDEDTYPVGGFASLSTRGTVESLLQSQLALMERAERPDLFDVKYVRDELLYYSRDENTFLRRRKTFFFLLYPDLVQARFKDARLPWQRVILLLAMVVVAVRRLCDWLSEDALRFEILFLDAGDAGRPLAEEHELLRMLLREQLANGTVVLEAVPTPAAAAERCARHGRRSLCHCLTVGTRPHRLAAEDTDVARLVLSGPDPELATDDATPREEDAHAEGVETWGNTLARLLQRWI